MSSFNRRILIVDDNPAIHEDFRKIFCSSSSGSSKLEATEAALFGGPTIQRPEFRFELDFASQGQEAFELVRRSLSQGRRYAAAFMDMRMPPGWDGVETTHKIWEIDRQLQVIFCTAFSDYSWENVTSRLGNPDGFVILKKPFETVEVQQLANAFCAKWNAFQDTQGVHEQLRQSQLNLERRVAERTEELSEARNRMEHLLSSSPSVIYSVKLPDLGNVAFVSQNVSTILGYSIEEFTGDPQFWANRLHPDDVNRISIERAKLIEDGNHPIEYRLRHKDGSYRWIHDDARVIRQGEVPVELIGSLVDMTQRKQVEEKVLLQTSALEAAHNAILIANRLGQILWGNPALTQLTGYSAAELVGQTPALFKSGAHDRQFYEDMWNTILSGKVWNGEIINRRKDGSHYYEEMTIAPVLDASGKVRNFVAIKRDISRRKEFEQELAHERELLETLMGGSQDCIYFKDLESRFIRCSKNMLERFGCRQMEDVVGKTDFDFFAEEHARPAFEDEQEIIRTGKPIIGKIEQEFWKDDARSTWVLTNKMPLRNKSGDVIGTFGISRDITELKQSERDRQMIEVQLRQAQKLEAIGQLAAGIAHEINTPTQYVGDNTRFLKDSFGSIAKVLQGYDELFRMVKDNSVTPESISKMDELIKASDIGYLFEQVPAAIRETLEGVERVARIVRAMKEFSHPGSKEKVAADLNKAIESTVTVARNEWKYVADVQLDLDPQLPAVPCFVGEFNQVVLNLIINASHAIGDVVKRNPGTKGRITVTTRRDEDFVEMRVADTGTGIPESARPRIFEPFFTTKDVGKGTGQGLSMIYGSVVKKHGGTITFETETGKGTTFIVRLPLTPRSDSEPQTAAERSRETAMARTAGRL